MFYEPPVRLCISSVNSRWIGGLLLVHLILVAKQCSAQQIRLIPYIPEQVFAVGSNITLTCIFEDVELYKDNSLWQAWQLPDYVAKHPELSDASHRLSQTYVKNGTHMISTMTLTNAETKDTGYFGCTVRLFRLRDENYEVKQYVYVSSNDNNVFIDDQQGGMKNSTFIFEHGNSGLVPCKSTHPNVTVSLIRNSRNLLSEPNSNWLMESKRGLILHQATFEDTGDYQCIGTVNNISTKIFFKIFVEGIELIRVDNIADPWEGNNVTLICRANTNPEFASPPEWFFKSKFDMSTLKRINETGPSEGIKISLTNDELGVYESRLELLNVNRQTTHREFKCNSKIDNKTVSKEISFFITGPDHSWIIYGLILPIGIIVLVMIFVAIIVVIRRRYCASCDIEESSCCVCLLGLLNCLQMCTYCCLAASDFSS
ncbi:vascular endothelial growth factor receptor 1-like [Daphnia pulex]|uniref:vascular endothelial growth factor receptor 1-like n=1 Tax=Daphnia pulex TaxID=6669 RepID=UPI001EDDB777|nr:vascular endothelial growth factor receptor 1-like [Daphnia pulex]